VTEERKKKKHRRKKKEKTRVKEGQVGLAVKLSRRHLPINFFLSGWRDTFWGFKIKINL
jgi:hypothetical protein